MHLSVHPTSPPSARSSIPTLINAFHCHWHGVSVPFFWGVRVSQQQLWWPRHPVLFVWVLRELPCKQDADKSESGTLEGEEFVLFYKALTQREEVLSLFQEYSEDGRKLTLLELADFLREEQLEDEGTEELAMKLIDKYEPSETGESWFRHQLCSAWGQGGVRDSQFHGRSIASPILV